MCPAMAAAANTELVDRLRAIVGADGVLTAASDLMVYVAVSQFPIFMFPLLVQLGRGLRQYVSSPSAGR